MDIGINKLHNIISSEDNNEKKQWIEKLFNNRV